MMSGVFGAVEVEKGLVNFCVTEKVSKENIDSILCVISDLAAVIANEHGESENL
jgi:hypothetical protein